MTNMTRPLALSIALAMTAGVAVAQQTPGGSALTGQQPQQGQQARQRLPAARGPQTALALEAAQTAISTCTANGYHAAASVVDSAGVLKVLLAADGTRKLAVEASTKKAETANALKAATSSVLEQMKTDNALVAKVSADPTLFVRAGGIPLMVGSDVIGAIGVGGAPGGEKDEACAKAGVEKVQARLK
jgi:uncharacterized protein GlcG (DUF336 family)